MENKYTDIFETENIISQVTATMRIENLNLTDSEKQNLRDVLNNKKPLNVAIREAVDKHSQVRFER